MGLAGLLLVLGCSDPVPPRSGVTSVTVNPLATAGDPLATARAEAYQRAEQRFTTAAFVRPAPDSTLPPQLQYLAPLIMQEPQDPTAEPVVWERFGAVSHDPAGHAKVDTERLTVYFYPSEALLAGREYRQWTYVWFYPPATGSLRIRFRGFRMTLDPDGLPIVWEAAADGTELHALFVSAALAADASQAWGPPLTGRRYAIEPPLESLPDVAVVRLLSDGPQPMGPYVYLEGRHLTCTTLLCRCSPSQIDRWFLETMYDLVRLKDLGELSLDGQITTNLGLSTDPTWLEKTLRLPRSRPTVGDGSASDRD